MIIISPYSNPLPGGNAKNYAHWPEVCSRLKAEGHKLVQIGRMGEARLPHVDQHLLALSLEELKKLVNGCETWASVDNFFPHLCSHTSKPGTAIFTRSDPRIYGYLRNTNLLKARRYLRPDPFGAWPDCPPVPEASIDPDVVVTSILSLA
jgi:hypothetical protein